MLLTLFTFFLPNISDLKTLSIDLNLKNSSERPNLSGSGSGSAELAGSVVRPNQQVRSAEPKPNQFYPIYAIFIRF